MILLLYLMFLNSSRGMWRKLLAFLEEELEENEEAVEQSEVDALHEKAQIEEMAEPAQVQNISLMEPVQSRNVGHLVAAMSKLRAKFRMLGINVMRLHTDREKSFRHAKVQKWCNQRQLVQTMTSGDDPAKWQM